MTKKQWERNFLRCLRSLPQREREQALEYYREIYGDKAEAGYSEQEILREFGFPEDCAERILAERSEAPRPNKTARDFADTYTVEGLGLSLLGFILFLPLSIVSFSLIVAFGAVSLAGGAVAAAGIVYAIAAPFLSIGNLTAAGGFGCFGIGLLMCGIGALLCVGFFCLTKLTVHSSGKVWHFFFRRNRL